jgi:hypothetical protein
MHYNEVAKAAEKAAEEEAENARRRLVEDAFHERIMNLESELGYHANRGLPWMNGVIDRLVNPQTAADGRTLREYIALTKADRYNDGVGLIHRMHDGLLQRLKMAATVGSLETIHAVLSPLMEAPRVSFVEVLRLILSKKELQRKNWQVVAALLQGVAQRYRMRRANS